MKLFFILSVLFSGWTASAHAYPEMVRHGYVNCTTCHVSPSGGGILTPYGRQLSKEVLSTWGSESETQFAYGAVKSPEWLNLGGDYRHVYLYENTPTVRQGSTIFMQADLEAAISVGKRWIIDATAGYKSPNTAGPTPSSTTPDHFLSRRHYVNYRPTDELSFRAGKFDYNYGINMAEHTTIVRGGLAGVRTGLRINDEGWETYNLEAAWIGENVSTFVDANFGRPDAPTLQREKGFNLNSSVAVGTTNKIGFDYLYGTSPTANRSVFGPYGILGFTKNCFLLSELDFQNNHPSIAGTPPGTSEWGYGSYLRLDYELFQGFHLFLTQEMGRLNFKNDQTLMKEYGVGSQFFPRPHFEFEFTWQKQALPSIPNTIDVAYLMVHYYL